MWDPRRLTTLWASTACYRDSFTIYNGNTARSRYPKPRFFGKKKCIWNICMELVSELQIVCKVLTGCSDATDLCFATYPYVQVVPPLNYSTERQNVRLIPNSYVFHEEPSTQKSLLWFLDRDRSGKRFWLLFWRCLVRTSVEAPTIMVEVFCGFPQSLQDNAMLQSRPLPS
jgi:hypothetical protein